MRKLTWETVASVAVVSLAAVAQSMDLPGPVRVPVGHKMTMRALGVGEITYECRARTNDAAALEWAFTGPVARLLDASNNEAGKYYAGPTWEATDGSKVTGTPVAVAPAAPGNIPIRLVKTEPAIGQGAMTGVTYIQRVNTKGGVAPGDGCVAATAGAKRQVP